MRLWKVLTRAFIEPHVVNPGDVIEYSGPPGPHLAPMNEEAEKAMDTYIKANPHATMRPVDALSDKHEVALVQQARPQAVDLSTMLQQSLGQQNLTPKPGLSSGQTLPPAINVGGVAVHMMDGPDSGSNGKAVDGALDSTTLAADGIATHPESPLTGDPTKPGEPAEFAAKNKLATDKANTAAAEKK